MHKKFYASGFLYHSPTQRILLQQHFSSSSSLLQWSLFSSAFTEEEKHEDVFKNVIFDLLCIKIGIVYPVYSYLHEETGTKHVIVYSELKTLKDFPSKENFAFAWFSFKEVPKMQIAEQIKHDIVVGQRVINAADRSSRGEHTFQ